MFDRLSWAMAQLNPHQLLNPEILVALIKLQLHIKWGESIVCLPFLKWHRPVHGTSKVTLAGEEKTKGVCDIFYAWEPTVTHFFPDF